MSAPRVITLTSDFGTADGYVGAMKGRILSIAPLAALCDLSHDVPPQDVQRGAWCLRRALPHFPPGTVHLAVVDPGVGSPREALLVETERFLLVGPDNGLLFPAARADGLRRVLRIVENPPHWQRSATFDGLSLFAPVAAHLAVGLDPAQVGQPAERWVEVEPPAPQLQGGTLLGQVQLHDRFGNCITTITQQALGERALHGLARGQVQLVPGPAVRWCHHYGELAPGQVGALWNSDGLLELTLRDDSLRERYGIRVGHVVQVVLP
ncbi:MAG TPA: SAM-dependent chlorinase/fluorinase [bacterium]|nr:SAM-dependent chlorinase/fluorinase [bacterium]